MGSLGKENLFRSFKECAKIVPMVVCSGLAGELINDAKAECMKYLDHKVGFDTKKLMQEVLSKFTEKHQDVHGVENITYWSPLKVEGGDRYFSNLRIDPTLLQTPILEVFKFSLGVELNGYHCYCLRSIVYYNFDRKNVYDEYMLKVFVKVLESLRDGVELCKVYEEVYAFAKKENLDLARYLEKDFGFKVGRDFNNPRVVINAHTRDVAKEDMFFAINIRLLDIEEQGVTYSLHICNTVMIREGQAAFIVTDAD